MSKRENEARPRSQVPFLGATYWLEYEVDKPFEEDYFTEWRKRVVLSQKPRNQLTLRLSDAASQPSFPAERIEWIATSLEGALRKFFITARLETSDQLLKYRYNELRQKYLQLEDRVRALEEVLNSYPPTRESAPPISNADDYIGLHNLGPSLEVVTQLATRFFGVAASTEYVLENDSDLGGDYLAVQIGVEGLSRSDFRLAQKGFYEAVGAALDPEIAKHFVLAVKCVQATDS